jgi:hypothetical protein
MSHRASLGWGLPGPCRGPVPGATAAPPRFSDVTRVRNKGGASRHRVAAPDSRASPPDPGNGDGCRRCGLVRVFLDGEGWHDRCTVDDAHGIQR